MGLLGPSLSIRLRWRQRAVTGTAAAADLSASGDPVAVRDAAGRIGQIADIVAAVVRWRPHIAEEGHAGAGEPAGL